MSTSLHTRDKLKKIKSIFSVKKKKKEKETLEGILKHVYICIT